MGLHANPQSPDAYRSFAWAISKTVILIGATLFSHLTQPRLINTA